MCVCLYVCVYVNIFKHLLLWNHWPIEAKFHNGASLGWGNKNLLSGAGHMTKMAAMPIYGKNLKQNLLLRTQTSMTLKLGMQHWVLEYYLKTVKMMSLGWPWPILRQSQIWSLMFLYGENVKQWIFQKLLLSVITKLIVGRCSQLNEYMKLHEYQKSRLFIESKVTQIQHFKFIFLTNCLADWNQILCGASMGWGNDRLCQWSRLHDQYGRHAHIW